MLQDATSAVERWSLEFNVRRDGEILRRAAAIVSTSQLDRARRPPPLPGLPRRRSTSCPTRCGSICSTARGSTSAAIARPARASSACSSAAIFRAREDTICSTAWDRGGFARRADLTLVTGWPLRSPLPAGVRVLTGIRALHARSGPPSGATADLFVMPTRNEAFGLVYQEAAAAGLPAIGTRLNAVPEIIDDGVTGLLVTPGDSRRAGGGAGSADRVGRAARRLGRARAGARSNEEADPERHRRGWWH